MKKRLEKLKKLDGLTEESWAWMLVAVLLCFLWRTPILMPLQIFPLFLHEIGHAVGAWLTGGHLLEFQVRPELAGHARTYGGIPVVVYSAGYLGNVLFGAFIFWWATRTRWSEYLSIAIGSCLFVLTLSYSSHAFTRDFGRLIGAFLIWLGCTKNEHCEIVLTGIGFISVTYSLYDILSDVILRSAAPSDARLLAEHLGYPILTIPIGLVWIVLSGWVAWSTVISVKTADTVHTTPEPLHEYNVALPVISSGYFRNTSEVVPRSTLILPPPSDGVRRELAPMQISKTYREKNIAATDVVTTLDAEFYEVKDTSDEETHEATAKVAESNEAAAVIALLPPASDSSTPTNSQAQNSSSQTTEGESSLNGNFQ